MPGIFISDGMRLRIPAGGLTLKLGDDGIEASPLRVEVLLDMWPFWLDVATDHAVDARAARRQLVAAAAASGGSEIDGTLQGQLLAQECQAGMVAIAASAFALDNFYTVIQPFVPAGPRLRAEWAAEGTPRHVRVSESMRRTFKVGNSGGKRLAQAVREIFAFRDQAVHPSGDFSEPIKHDYLDVGVEWRFVYFRVDNAVGAVRAAASLIDQCVHDPRKNNKALVAWCEGHVDRSSLRWRRVESELTSTDSRAKSAPSSPR